ncbi:hypothetical protein [Nocardia sp. NPDC049707]|uniref:hypothetical protein n=1 Tax=Nocardia sp. NPDC049707 TaxID=3154735 RepID=UPI003426F034
MDETHLAVVPVLLGAGERLCENLGTVPGYRISAAVRSPGVTHVTFTRERLSTPEKRVEARTPCRVRAS